MQLNLKPYLSFSKTWLTSPNVPYPLKTPTILRIISSISKLPNRVIYWKISINNTANIPTKNTLKNALIRGYAIGKRKPKGIITFWFFSIICYRIQRLIVHWFQLVTRYVLGSERKYLLSCQHRSLNILVRSCWFQQTL